MTCFHPIPAFYPCKLDIEGKRRLKFGNNRYKEGYKSSQYVWMSEILGQDVPFTRAIYDYPYDFPIYINENFETTGFNIKVPCGKCLGCRLDYSRAWATRSVHEAYMHNHYKDCAFLTLTFNNDMLSRRTVGHSLNKVAFRCWLKRLRKAVKCNYNKEFRFMACGEYGSKHRRPHYHILIYGFNFPDKYVYKYNRIKGRDILYYRSTFLERIWSPAYSDESYGFSVIGDVNFESSAYVARYVTKKLFGEYAEKVYKDKEPEFLLTSRMPGLGYSFLVENYKDIFNHGCVTLPNGFKAPIPRYYSNKLIEINASFYSKWLQKKHNLFFHNLFSVNPDATKERLFVREELKRNNLNILHRMYEFN